MLLTELRFDHKKYFMLDLEVIKLFSCSTQFSMKFILLINLKIPTIFYACSAEFSMKKVLTVCIFIFITK